MPKEPGAEVGAETPSGSTVAAPSASVLATPFQSGEIIGGRYRIDRVIAEGGMAVIVAATHIELDETVAIKFLKHSFAVNPEIVGRFAREAKAAARIKSECTAAVHDVGISPERGPYIVMEFLEGEDFQRILEREGALPFPRAAELVVQGCIAIALAHANAIIHRDIKPANLFLLRGQHGSPRVKVLDFGVSKGRLTGATFGGAAALVSTQSIVGSPAYMAPEQLRGASDLNVTADIWSLGAVLYQLLTGRIPFEATTVTDLYAKMLEAPPTPPIDLVPDVPPGLSDAIMRCFALAPEERWQSVAAFVVAIGPYAPRRARAAVDRVVAVSKGAGLLEPGMTPRSPSSAPPEAGQERPSAPSALPRLFQTMVDTHGGTGPMPALEELPRLFQTMVDTHGGGEALDGSSIPPEESGAEAEAARVSEPPPPRPGEMPRARTAIFVLSCTLILASVAFFRWRTQTVPIEPASATAAPIETVVSPPPPLAAPPEEEPAPVVSSAPPPSPIASSMTAPTIDPPASLPLRIHRPTTTPSPSARAQPPLLSSGAAPSATSPASALAASPAPAPAPSASASTEDRVHRAIEDRK